MRLADIVQPAKASDPNARHAAFGVIESRHVDFVVCDPETLEFRLVVELDDKSHERANRVARDQKVDEIMAQVGISILHFQTKTEYWPDDIRRRIFGGQKNETETQMSGGGGRRWDRMWDPVRPEESSSAGPGGRSQIVPPRDWRRATTSSRWSRAARRAAVLP